MAVKKKTRSRSKVEGHSHLEKDLSTGAVVNTNHRAYLQAKARKKANKEKDEQISSLQGRIGFLEEAITKLLNNNEKN